MKKHVQTTSCTEKKRIQTEQQESAFLCKINLPHLDQCQTNRWNWPFPLYSIFVGLGETWGSTGSALPELHFLYWMEAMSGTLHLPAFHRCVSSGHPSASSLPEGCVGLGIQHLRAPRFQPIFALSHAAGVCQLGQTIPLHTGLLLRPAPPIQHR